MYMSLIGKELETFTAEAYNPLNGEIINVSDEDLKGKCSVVCFYPADLSVVCPTELEDMQYQHAALKDLDAEVYSVSTDSPFVHKAWYDHSDANNTIEYTMIGDPSQPISRKFDV